MSLEEIIQFAKNPEPRCPVVLLLDTSQSMSGQPISELNAGVATFKQEVYKNEKARLRVEVAIITISNEQPQLVQPFVTINEFNPQTLTTSGRTPMGQAIELALDKVEARKQTYNNLGISYYQPWVVLITDGEPTDDWQNAAQRVQEATAANKLCFFAIGVRNAKMEILKQIAPSTTPPVMLDGLKFQELFRWLSGSMERVSTSQIGDQVDLPSISGWGKVKA
ncbi:vWA domain-containing protein [Aerosakkonema funiforme]|uniref:vWA domain-containing protein n=1 Tax=Aerosakkonema funiforme TaxID=1246630 RepID=UPI0035B7D42A